MPRLHLEFGVEYGVHAHRLVSEDGRHGRRAEDPGEEVPPASEPATDSPISSSSYGCPVVDCDLVSSGIFKSQIWWINAPPLEDGMADANSAIEAAISQ